MSRLNLSEDELKELRTFAELLYTDKDLAEILEVREAQLQAEMMHMDGEVSRVIRSARYLQESKLRKANIQMALNGSTPAMTQALELLIKIKS